MTPAPVPAASVSNLAFSPAIRAGSRPSKAARTSGSCASTTGKVRCFSISLRSMAARNEAADCAATPT